MIFMVKLSLSVGAMVLLAAVCHCPSWGWDESDMAMVLMALVIGGMAGSAVATSGIPIIINQHKTVVRFMTCHSRFIAKLLYQYGRSGKSYQPDVRIHP